MSIREVTPNVYVSDYSNAIAHAASFDLVVNCTDNLGDVASADKTVRIPVADNKDANDAMYDFWVERMGQIEECVRAGGRVLIHCFGGVSRSASTAVAYILHTDPTRSVMECVEEVRARKSDTFMTREMNFKDALERYRTRSLISYES